MVPWPILRTRIKSPCRRPSTRSMRSPVFSPSATQAKEKFVRSGRHHCRQHPQTRNQGRGRGAGQQVPLRSAQAVHPGEQLDLSAAADDVDGALRQVPDLLRRLPHLRGERQESDSIGRPTAPRSSGASTTSTSREGSDLGPRRHRSQLEDRRPADRARPIAATSAGAARRPAPSASTTAYRPARSASSSARRWASPPRSSTRTARCCS